MHLVDCAAVGVDEDDGVALISELDCSVQGNLGDGPAGMQGSAAMPRWRPGSL